MNCVHLNLDGFTHVRGLIPPSVRPDIKKAHVSAATRPFAH